MMLTQGDLYFHQSFACLRRGYPVKSWSRSSTQIQTDKTGSKTID